MKVKYLPIRLSEELHDQVRTVAAEQNLTASEYIRRVLRAAATRPCPQCEGTGMVPDPLDFSDDA